MTREKEYYGTLRTEDADTGAVLVLEMTVTGGTLKQAAKAFRDLLQRVRDFDDEDIEGQILVMSAD